MFGLRQQGTAATDSGIDEPDAYASQVARNQIGTLSSDDATFIFFHANHHVKRVTEHGNATIEELVVLGA
jgi:hypothetical protein